MAKSLYQKAFWFHHYLQHPGTKCDEETLHLSMNWKGLRTTVQSHVKNCHNCQVNKHRKHKYGKLPAKLAITNPWEALCVDLIGPYTLKGKDKSQIDFMCITMITPATSWLRLWSCPYYNYLSLIFLQVQRGKGARTHISKQNNPALTRRQTQ